MWRSEGTEKTAATQHQRNNGKEGWLERVPIVGRYMLWRIKKGIVCIIILFGVALFLIPMHTMWQQLLVPLHTVTGIEILCPDHRS